MYLPELYPGLAIQSRSAARRAAQDLVIIKGHRKVYLQNIDGIWLAEYQKTWIWSSVF